MARFGRLAGSLLIGLVAAIGCASKHAPSSLAAAEAERWSEVPAADDEAGAAVGAEAQAPEEERADDEDAELDLAVYERMLVEQELRLRSAGVAVAIADESVGSRDFTSTVEPATPFKSADAGVGSGYGRGAGGGVVGGAQGGSSPSAPKSAPTPAPRPSTTTRGDASPKKKATSASRSSAKRAEPPREREADTCLTICELAAATCDLEQRICELASRHQGEARYQQVCARAGEDCRVATAACERCAV